jgi:hypothetical protein
VNVLRFQPVVGRRRRGSPWRSDVGAVEEKLRAAAF